MDERPFGMRVFHSENELKADRLNKLEVCRFNTLRTVIQKEKTLYEKHYKQKYDLMLRCHTFRRISDTRVLQERRAFPPTSSLQRRFSASTATSRSTTHNLIARKRPVSYSGASNTQTYSSDDNCTLCEQIVNKIHTFKSEENITFVKDSESAVFDNEDTSRRLNTGDAHGNLNNEFDDYTELHKCNEDSTQRRLSEPKQVSIHVDASTDTVENSRSYNDADGQNPQNGHRVCVTFNKMPSVETEPDINVTNTDLSVFDEMIHNIAPSSSDERNLDSQNAIRDLEQSIGSTLCPGQNQYGLRIKLKRFMKFQDEYNKRNPLSREISRQSELCRLKSSTCERKKKAERPNYGPKDAIINEVLTTLRLNEEEPIEDEILPPIIN